MKKIGYLFMLLALTVISCENSNTSNLVIKLTDAPADYEEVNIDVQGLRMNSTLNSEEGWEDLDLKEPGVYNLLDFTGGLDTVLVNMDIVPTRIEQIRLVLGENNSIKVDGETYPLTIPSGSESGLKLNVHQELLEGISYEMILDFDAALSVRENGQNIFKLHPVIRVNLEAQTGSIKGVVMPLEADAVIYAIKGIDTVGAYLNDANNFIIKLLSEGDYKVVVAPSEGYTTIELESVNVSVGVVTDVDTLIVN